MYLEVDEGLFEHPKTLRLNALLRDPNAVVYPLRLWRWACRCAPDGNLSTMEPAEIELAVGYQSMDGACFAALVKAGFIDDIDGHREIHNWMMRTGGAIEKMGRRAAQKRLHMAHSRGKCGGAPVCGYCVSEVPPAVADTNENVADTNGHVSNKTSQDKTRQDKTRDPEPESCAETAKPSSTPNEPALLVFPTDGKDRTWPLTNAAVAEWATAYPALDILAECRKALAWVQANTSKRKTAKGMPAFLVGWLNRAQNSGRGAKTTAAPSPARKPTEAELLQRKLEILS